MDLRHYATMDLRHYATIDFEPKSTAIDWIFSLYPSNINFFSKAQVEDEIEEILSKIPERLLFVTEALGWEVIVTNTRDLEKEGGFDTKVYGYTNFELKKIVVYATKEGIRESLPHEFAHILDSILHISESEEWVAIYNSEKEDYSKLRYFTACDNPTECFADAFLTYVLNKNELNKNTPCGFGFHAQKTRAVMENIFSLIDYLLDEDTIKGCMTEEYNNKA